ncbi:phage terminase large subunit family protein [Chitiniphilus purpureus]|uniref:Phage terminase large subunit family protein n=1 Tax=Chitiniphilus purpureus TaxID=2981137 RepID=A0ABY6DHL8_9NEIS|nr:phage terminase large subunit family protein [Chitiniphilus sp. CD1]UXY13850.1 phage terminase large subunit family protein [Chitiniphilus sp. CD1]
MTSLADIQLESAKLAAKQKQDELTAALAGSIALSDLAPITAAARQVMLDLLDRLADRMVEATAGERDETRLHYLMSESARVALMDLGPALERACVAAPTVGQAMRRGAKPRDLLTVSQWADRNRWLQSGTNAPGRWNTDLTPYLREVMDSLSEHSAVRWVTFIKSSGVGGTEAGNNWIGYVMHHLGNQDMLVVMPTLELRDRSFNPRLAKMIDETPVLSALVSRAKRDKSNRADLLEYAARARIVKAGANSPDSLRSDHLPYVLCDEVAAFPWDVGGEGDPMTLIDNRQRTYTRAKTFLVSTPTRSQHDRIYHMWLRSDQRRFHVQCPHCGELQHLEFTAYDSPGAVHGLKWQLDPPVDDESTPQVARAYYICKANGCVLEEHARTALLASGRWIAARPHIKLHRGYHINALYAPIGLGLDWKTIAQKWLNAQGDTAELKAFVNTFLGWIWEEPGDSIEGISLISRREQYERGTIRYAIVVAGVDVQKDRLECSIVAFGTSEEAWLLDHVILPGDTAKPEVWEQLGNLLQDEGVEFACIDSGYNASMVYEFCKSRAWCMPIKGVPGLHRPLVEDERRRRQRMRTRRKRGVAVEPLGVDQGKALLYARLRQQEPGPGYIHFPIDSAFDEEYFAQLAAEKLVTKVRGTRPFQEWVQMRPRNETLDCLNYALAAVRLSGRDLTKLKEIQPLKPQPKPVKVAAKPRGIASDDWSNRL